MALVPCVDVLASIVDRVEVQTASHAILRRPMLPLSLDFKAMASNVVLGVAIGLEGKCGHFGRRSFSSSFDSHTFDS